MAGQTTYLVTGASGQLGQRVVALLLEAQSGNIIAATRTPEKLQHLSGVTVRRADFDDPASLAEAFAGVDRLLLISTDTVGVPGKRIEQHRNAVAAAESAGVKHIVYTSLVNPTNTPVVLAPDHAATEQALAESKPGWTVLRENIYAETLLGSLKGALMSGSLVNAIGDGKAAYITREDVAQAAVAALTSDYEGQRILDITGPEALSQADLAAIVSEIGGQQVSYVPVDIAAVVETLIGFGLPRPLAETYASFDTGIAQGKFADVTTTVQELSGRQPTRVRDFVAAHRELLLEGAAAS
jgi:NAD(P)H dehydrogenase (quinone)